jgi:hypothetical protein
MFSESVSNGIKNGKFKQFQTFELFKPSEIRIRSNRTAERVRTA